ncbi:hypothetical protein IGI04_038772 [Brassica rapa subsp. trilocularis]|uniref:Uncharacterized protein n=3 Tax=Brassica TaxID=3705 RepID=A0A3P5YTK2_BRACM|nr:hypothetical protein IGI04_038772 [Brassica rapa subsp. trilocularis]CAF2051059.1 unnamed protein product [Brassica napus]CAG7867132.1 unnamed protein product [Brassica rapa]CDY26623.1 BnaA09g46540D [Brassica napus]VDC64071.1 unnamed protein product [Brassica rapa]
MVLSGNPLGFELDIHVPEDKVVIYQSKGSLMKTEMASLGPPGYEPDQTPKPVTKAAKRNERKKEKRRLSFKDML